MATIKSKPLKYFLELPIMKKHILKNRRGFGLLEILVAGAIGTVLTYGSIKGITLSMQSSQVVKSTFTETDLRSYIRQALTGSCAENFKPQTWPNGRLAGDNKLKGLGTVNKLTKTGNPKPLIKIGDFKGNLDIVSMELKGTGDAGSGERTRNFIVYYKKKNVGSFNTLKRGNGKCDGTGNRAGCYFRSCELNYQLDISAKKVTKCEAITCRGAKHYQT